MDIDNFLYSQFESINKEMAEKLKFELRSKLFSVEVYPRIAYSSKNIIHVVLEMSATSFNVNPLYTFYVSDLRDSIHVLTKKIELKQYNIDEKTKRFINSRLKGIRFFEYIVIQA